MSNRIYIEQLKKDEALWPNHASAYVYCLETGKYKFIDCNLGDIYKCLHCVPVARKDNLK